MPGFWASKTWGGLAEVLKGPVGALKGPVGALEGFGLFDPKGSLWSSLSDLLDVGPMRPAKAWPLCARHPCP